MNNIDPDFMKGIEAMQDKDYARAIPFFDNILKRDPNDIGSIYSKAHCLAGLRNVEKDEARRQEYTAQVEALSRQLIENIPEFSLGPYIKEDLMPREMLRFAYNALAWYAMERATNIQEYEEALHLIDHCLGLQSPIDKENILHAYIDTKVRILLKMGKADEAYRLVDTVFRKQPDFADLADIKKSEGYKAWREKEQKAHH